jgi:hypothetical protein
MFGTGRDVGSISKQKQSYESSSKLTNQMQQFYNFIT